MHKILTSKEKINSEQLFQKATTTDLRGQFETLQEEFSTSYKKTFFQPKNY